jgi:hypothetical protein
MNITDIRKKKEEDRIKKAELEKTLHGSILDFCDYDISFDGTFPKGLLWYTNPNKSQYTYELREFDYLDGIPDEDTFADEYFNNDGILSSMYKAEYADADWLTGYYLAQKILSKLYQNTYNVNLITCHSGGMPGTLL